MAKNNNPSEAIRPDSASTAQKQPETGSVMYIGPSLVETGVPFAHGQIFNNGLPPEWTTKAKLQPEFGRLIVPVSRVGAAMAELRDPQSHLSTLYKSVLAASKVQKEARK
ncbi:MAG: hypothetical protein LUC93_03075 [Planctomycetaceae bacterium]|nr:hypothetical protein [Planctomycetaceae bacterium]